MASYGNLQKIKQEIEKELLSLESKDKIVHVASIRLSMVENFLMDRELELEFSEYATELLADKFQMRN